VTLLAEGSPEPLAARYDTALVDLDGVVYIGPDVVPGAAESLAKARGAGMRVAFVTNNAARTPAAVAAHLRDLGVEAEPDDVVTSAQAAATLVAERVPADASVLVVGGEGLRAALTERGLRPVASADDDPAAVVQGFAPEVGWTLLTEGAIAVRRGLPWVASNLDRTVPTARGLAPGNGALVSVIAAVTGTTPQVVAGKPELALHMEAVRRTGAKHPLVVGDRLDTDVEGANRAGVDSLLVLTGVTSPGELVWAAAALRPSYIAEDLESGLLAPHPPVQARDGTWLCGGWAARRDGTWHVEGTGPRIDGLRALCAGVWSSGEGAVDARSLAAALDGLPDR